MRRSIAVFFCIFCINILHAQIETEVSLGVQFGNVQTSQLFPFNTTLKPGLFLGIGLSKEINHIWKVKSEIQYSSKGARITGLKGNSIAYLETRPLTRRYIEFIPTLEYRASEFIAFTFGPDFGYKLQEKFNGDSPAMTSNRLELSLFGGIKILLQKNYVLFGIKQSLQDSNSFMYTDEAGQLIPNIVNKHFNVLFGMGMRL